jgi:hypothetical protein
MKPGTLYRIVIGVVMILSGIVSILLSAGEAIISTILLAAGFAFLITGISRHRKYGNDPESDERSKKIGAYGLSWAWLTGLFFMFGLFWLDYLGILRLSTQNALAFSVVVLALSAVIYQSYLFRKGDVG